MIKMGDIYPSEWIGIENRQDNPLPMWEIFVPASKTDKEFTYEHHKLFDEFVKQRAGGITILRGAKGEWIAPDGELYKDRIIPCRICCSKESIQEIMNFALKHYGQKAIMAYKISDEVLMIRA